MLPTLAEVGGATDHVPDDIDGLSFLQALLANSRDQKQHRYLYWAFYERGGAQAVRMGKWKAVWQPLRQPLKLFDIEADLGETQDLAAKYPDVVGKMKGFMKEAYEPSERWKFPKAKARGVGALRVSGRG